MASKPQTFSRMKFSLVIYGVLKQLGLACRPAPPCLVLPNLASHWAGSAKVEDSRATSWALPSPIPVSMPLPAFHPSFKEDVHSRLGSSSTTQCSPSQPPVRQMWLSCVSYPPSAPSQPLPRTTSASDVQVPRTHFSSSVEL